MHCPLGVKMPDDGHWQKCMPWPLLEHTWFIEQVGFKIGWHWNCWNIIEISERMELMLNRFEIFADNILSKDWSLIRMIK